jgi:hypothetical protein
LGVILDWDSQHSIISIHVNRPLARVDQRCSQWNAFIKVIMDTLHILRVLQQPCKSNPRVNVMRGFPRHVLFFIEFQIKEIFLKTIMDPSSRARVTRDMPNHDRTLQSTLYNILDLQNPTSLFGYTDVAQEGASFTPAKFLNPHNLCISTFKQKGFAGRGDAIVEDTAQVMVQTVEGNRIFAWQIIVAWFSEDGWKNV